jgi:hypothetical protein
MHLSAISFAFNSSFLNSFHCVAQTLMENRFNRRLNKTECYMTVDGTNFKVYKLLPFDPKWLSHKSNAPAVRYKVALLILSSDLVWINGSFWAGEWPYIKIFHRDLIHELEGGEKIQADRGYRGEDDYIRVPSRYNQDRKVARAQQVVKRGGSLQKPLCCRVLTILAWKCG